VQQGQRPNDARRYLAWIKAQTRRGHAVSMTVYMNNWKFYG
jgi:hypothetical protein